MRRIELKLDQEAVELPAAKTLRDKIQTFFISRGLLSSLDSISRLIFVAALALLVPSLLVFYADPIGRQLEQRTVQLEALWLKFIKQAEVQPSSQSSGQAPSATSQTSTPNNTPEPLSTSPAIANSQTAISNDGSAKTSQPPLGPPPSANDQNPPNPSQPPPVLPLSPGDLDIIARVADEIEANLIRNYFLPENHATLYDIRANAVRDKLLEDLAKSSPQDLTFLKAGAGAFDSDQASNQPIPPSTSLKPQDRALFEAAKRVVSNKRDPQPSSLNTGLRQRLRAIAEHKSGFYLGVALKRGLPTTHVHTLRWEALTLDEAQVKWHERWPDLTQDQVAQLIELRQALGIPENEKQKDQPLPPLQ